MIPDATCKLKLETHSVVFNCLLLIEILLYQQKKNYAELRATLTFQQPLRLAVDFARARPLSPQSKPMAASSVPSPSALRIWPEALLTAEHSGQCFGFGVHRGLTHQVLVGFKAHKKQTNLITKQQRNNGPFSPGFFPLLLKATRLCSLHAPPSQNF